MEKNEIYSYISDFLSLLYFKKDFLDKISSIVLFGSAARGNFDKESDIDIFIDIKNKEDTNDIEEIISLTLSEFELKAKENWYIRSIKNPIKCIVGVLNDDRWGELRKDIQSYGTVLYGNFISSSEGLSSYSLFEYSLKDFKQKNRVAFLRELLGYKSKKKKKTYAHKGLIEKINGIKLENNNIIIPSKEALALQKFFTKRKLTPKIREIWIKE